MKIKLTLTILAALLGGCAIVPVGYDDGYYYGHRDRYYRDRDDYHHDRWSGYDRDNDRYYSSGAYFRDGDHGQ